MVKKFFGRVIGTLLLTAVALGLSGQTANAAGIVGGASGIGTQLKLNYSNFPGNNGEFGAFVNQAGANGSGPAWSNPNGATFGKEDFRTFCAEVTEFLPSSQDTVLRVNSIGKTTVSTNKSLTAQAAWLFREFSLNRVVTAGLSSYVGPLGEGGAVTPVAYASNNGDANLLQDALWTLIGWTTSATTSNNKYLKLASDNAANANLLKVTGSSIGGVRFLNLVVNSNNSNTQDMFYYEALGGGDFSTNPVPEPVSCLVWGSVIAGICVSRARRNKA